MTEPEHLGHPPTRLSQPLLPTKGEADHFHHVLGSQYPIITALQPLSAATVARELSMLHFANAAGI